MKNFKNIIGKTKPEIIKILGDEMNIPYSNIWYYTFRENYFRKLILAIHFDGEGVATKIVTSKKIVFL